MVYRGSAKIVITAIIENGPFYDSKVFHYIFYTVHKKLLSYTVYKKLLSFIPINYGSTPNVNSFNISIGTNKSDNFFFQLLEFKSQGHYTSRCPFNFEIFVNL